MRTFRGNRAYGGLSLNAQVVIFSLATVLALATASECRSITHLPSLLYGIVLWEWWGCIASVLWAFGQSRFSSFSPRVATHALIAPLLAIVHLLLLGSLGFTVQQWQAHGTALSVWLHHLDINRFGLELLIYLCVVGVIGLVQFQIRAQRDDSLWIQVRDTGKGVGLVESQGYGIGMQNTRDRLAHFYPEEHQFSAGPMPSGGFEVTIQIPYERAAV